MKKLLLTASIAFLFTSSAQAYSLKEIIFEGEQNHPKVIMAGENIKGAKQGVETAKWQYFPTPSVSLEQAGIGVKQGGNQTSATLRLQQPVYTFGKLDNGVRKAEADLSTSEASYAEAKYKIGLEVIDHYVAWYGAIMKMQAIKKSLDTHERMKEMMGRRVAQGLSPETDMTLVESRLAAVQADYEAADNARSVALAKLSQVFGGELTDEQIEIEKPLMITQDLKPLVEMAKDISPVKQRLNATKNANLVDIDVTKSSIYPEIYVRAEYQNGASNTSPYLEDTRVYFGVKADIGAGMSIQSKTAQARSKYQASIHDVEVYDRDITQEISMHYKTYHQVKDRISSLSKAQTTADKISEAWGRQFVTGKKSWLDVMNAARELAQTETLLSESYASLMNASWKLALMTKQVS